MGGVVEKVGSVLLGKPGQQGPGEAERAAQQDRQRLAFEEKTEADKLAALSSRTSARSRALRFIDERKKQTLGG